MTYTIAIISTLAAWFVGLFADVNIDFGDPQGFLALRVLFPVLASECTADPIWVCISVGLSDTFVWISVPEDQSKV